MNLTLGFEADAPAAATLAPQSAAPVQALASRFQQAMQQDGSPVRAVRYEPARPPQFAPFPEMLNPALQTALGSRGIEQLYTHQSAAIEHALAGRNVAVVTPTASGKTL